MFLSPLRRSHILSTDFPANPRALLPMAAMLAAYGLAFSALHHIAALWGSGLFSLWFPAAGLRFAFLWRTGARMAPAAALAELLAQLVTGEATLGPAPALAIAGMVGPCLVYGLVIHFVRNSLERRRPMLGHSPLPFAIAAMAGPAAACVAALPWAIPLAGSHGPFDEQLLVSTLVVFTLGDMLGILVIAPPLLWLADQVRNPGVATPRARPALVIETVLVVIAGWALVAILAWSDLGLILGPVLLATCWIGLRTGRLGAWVAIVLATAIILPITSTNADEVERMGVHMLLVCIAAVGYLAGSYSEAVALAQSEIERRDRILFQADRLKTLRAMSVAVIHEISQPLSTISIEANNLVRASSSARPDMGEIGEVSQLIARKAHDLSLMVRRLRRFGERAEDKLAPIPLHPIFHDVAAIATLEAQAAEVSVEVGESPDVLIVGHDIELRQVLLNLLRNGIASAPPGSIVLVTQTISANRVHISVENHQQPAKRPGSGMGVGLIIARAIATAHGGSIREERPDAVRVRFILDLPVFGDSND